MATSFWNKRKKVLGINARTLQYSLTLNSPYTNILARNKLLTKNKLREANIKTPRTYGVIKNRRDVDSFEWEELPASFALKPNFGFGGAGILISFGKNKRGQWVQSRKKVLELPQIKERVYNILDGNYSSSNIPDIAFFEQRVRLAKELKPFSKEGIPDIRVLVANYIPVMAMLRLPTYDSGGRSNIHAGGIGVGVDLESGRATQAVYRGSFITNHPNSGLRLADTAISNFHETLLVAAQAAASLNLGFAGIDVVIDREEGPLVLEANTKPGLAIQLANCATLRDRLRRLEDLRVESPEHAVDITLSLFARRNKTEKKKKVVGVRERIMIYDNNGTPHSHIARVDTGAYRTSIDRELAEKYDLMKLAHPEAAITTKSALGKEKRLVTPIKMVFAGQEIETEATLAERGSLKHELLIGRRDITNYLVDPERKLPPRTYA